MQAIRIFKKEFRDYFISPIAYIVISLFLLVMGWFFFAPFFLYGQATLRSFFSLLPIVFSFIVPAVTMRLFSEELSVGSYEILLTMPVSSRDVIAGKFLAACAFVSAMLIPTLAYPATVALIGDLDWGPVIGGYGGALLLGGAYAAIGMCASSLTRNQIIAFIVATVICFTLTLIDKLLFFFPPAILGVIEYLGADYHFQNVARGIIDSRDIIYFAGVIFIGLAGTAMILEEKR